jgi:hypothetical protein
MESLRGVLNKAGSSGPQNSISSLARRFGFDRPVSVTAVARRVMVPEEKSFSAQVITPSGTALGGTVTMTLRSDGTYVFSGHMHDSGLDPYDFRVRAVVTAGPVSIAAQKSGHTDGTGSNPFGHVNRDCDWNEAGTNPDISLHWDNVKQGSMSVSHSYEDTGLLHTVEEIALDFVSFLVSSAIVGPGLAGVIVIGSELAKAAGVRVGPGGLVGVGVASGICIVFGPASWIPAIVAGVVAGAVVDASIKHRPMSAQEAAFAAQVFGDTLPPPDQIILTNLAGLSGRAFTTPNIDGTILVNLGDAFDHPDPMNYTNGAYPRPGQLFIHELTHAWQIAHRAFTAGLICDGIVVQARYQLGTDVYAYGAAGPPYSSFNIESQAAIVDQWFGGNGRNVPGRTAMNDKDPYFPYVANNIRMGLT